MVKIMEAKLLHKYICTLFQTQTCNSSLGPGCSTALPYKTVPPPTHAHTHLLSSVHKEFNSQAEAHLQAISNVAVELDQVMQKDWTLHPLRNPPSKVRTSEGDPGKQSGGWYVGVCERRTAGNPSSLFMLRWTLLSRFSVKAFKFITMFKLFQDFLFH